MSQSMKIKNSQTKDESTQLNNSFSKEYYKNILCSAKSCGYLFLTMSRYAKELKKFKNEKVALLRHDVDSKPNRAKIFFEVEEEVGAVSTNFLLTHDINYNPLAINNLKLFTQAESKGFEIGLHTNFVETGMLLGKSPDKILETELNVLRSYFDIQGVACHRNIDFMYNSLPHLEENWSALKEKHSFGYQAYEPMFVTDITFVNEGFNPHLGWRGPTPEDVISSGKSFCLSTHPHWWHRDHAFED